MGKAGNERRRLAKRKKKRQQKAEKQALYDSWVASGRNQKSRRWRRNSNTGTLRVRDPRSRNIGDLALYPGLNMPFLVKTYLMKERGIPNQFTGKHPARVREFIDRNHLFRWKGRVCKYNSAIQRIPVTDKQLFAMT